MEEISGTVNARNKTENNNMPLYEVLMGRDSSVGIETCYRLYGPGIESQWGRYFPHPSRPDLGPTQPRIQWVLGLSGG